MKNQIIDVKQSVQVSGIFLRLSATAVFFLLGCRISSLEPETELKLFNLSHLSHLYQEIAVGGQEMAVIHIYSEFPDYDWVEAKDEGMACVDDAARAAVVYLRHFEMVGDTASLRRGRNLLEFCRYMQADDGQFYNIILADRTINREGKTSYKSFGWWAARGLWALGEGYRVFHHRDPSYAATLKKHIQKSFVH
ncbi:MAG: hypothetical protein ACE5DO_13290, partial [Desulfobacterales bacterium]